PHPGGGRGAGRQGRLDHRARRGEEEAARRGAEARQVPPAGERGGRSGGRAGRRGGSGRRSRERGGRGGLTWSSKSPPSTARRRARSSSQTRSSGSARAPT